MATTKTSFKTDADLITAINANSGYSFITLATTTELKANKFSRRRNDEIKTLKSAGVSKKELPSKVAFSDVFKSNIFITSRRKGYGMGDYNYASMVNNKRVKEGVVETFESEAPKGRNFANTGRSLLVATNGSEQMYLRTYKFNKSVDDSVMHYEDGTPLKDSELKMLKDFTTPKTGTKSQGVEDEVIVRDFKIQSIIGVTVGDNLMIRDGFQSEF